MPDFVELYYWPLSTNKRPLMSPLYNRLYLGHDLMRPTENLHGAAGRK